MTDPHPFQDLSTDTLRRILADHPARADGRCGGMHNANEPRPMWRDCALRKLADQELDRRNAGPSSR